MGARKRPARPARRARPASAGAAIAARVAPHLPGPGPTLALIVALGAALRFYRLGAQSLWDDELFSRLAGAQPSAARAVVVGAFEDVHPPGYPLLMYAWQRACGDSEAALRVPSAAAGTLAVVAMFLLGRRLFSAREGLVAAALTAAAWFPIYYSQENRPYSALFLTTALLAYLAAELVARYRAGARPPLALGAAFCLVAVVASYLHYFGLYFVALLGLLLGGLSLRGALPSRAVAALYAPVALAYLPWASALAKQVARGTTWIRPPSSELVSGAYAFLLNERAEWFVALLALGFASWAERAHDRGEDVEARVRRPDRALVLLAAWAVVPTLGALAISKAVLPVITERNLIIVLPALYLLLARALTELEAHTHRLPAPAALVVALALADLALARDYYATPTKAQFREAARRVADEGRALPARPLVVSEAWHPSYFDYYFERSGSDLRVDATARTDDVPALVAARAPESVFLLAARGGRLKRRPEPAPYEGYEPAGRWPYLSWDVYRFRKKSEGGGE